MSDYIGNLVAKSLNLTTVLQPRLASRFEPLTPSVSLANEWQFDDTPSGGAMPQDVAAQAVPGSIEPKVMPHPAPVMAQPPPVQPVPHISVSDVVAPPDTPIAPRRLNPARNPGDGYRDQAANTSETGKVAQRTPASLESHDRLSDRRHVIQPAPSVGEVTGVQMPRLPVPPLVEEASARVSQPDHTTLALDRSVPVPAVLQPAINPSRPPITLQDGRQVSEPLRESPPKTIFQPAITVSRLVPAAEPPQSAQPAPPTIHVTIGRIEVRATPPPPSPKQRPAPAVMSLDDYLKRREGSGHE